MPRRLTTITALPTRDRLSFKLAVLFAASFLVVFFSGWLYDGVMSILENRVTDEAALAQPPVVAVDPKIERELASVLSSDAIPGASDVQDPFNDRAGIGANAKTNAAVTRGATPAAQASSKPRNTLLAGQMPKNDPRRTGTPGFPLPGGTNTVIPGMVSETPTVQRFRAREEQLRLGQQAAPESTVFEIEDLLPVGVVSGGDGQPEIMLYSQSLMRTLSFPVGAQFFDGWLAAWKPEGVEFGYANETGTVRLKTWARSVKQPDPKSSASNNDN